MALRRKLQLPPQQFEEKRFGQSREHGAISGSRRRGFAHQVAHRRPPPLLLLRMGDRLQAPSGAVQRLQRQGVFARADAKNRGQRFQQRIEPLIGMQKTADQVRRRPAPAVLHQGDMLLRRLRADFLDRHRRQFRIARHDMLVTAREYDHIAGFDVDRRQCARGYEAAPLSDYMKRRYRPLGNLESRRKHRGRRGQNGPWVREFRPKMNGPGQAHDAQDFRQNVHDLILHSCRRRASRLARKLFRMHPPVKRHSVAAKLIGAMVIALLAKLRHKLRHYPYLTIMIITHRRARCRVQ
jgi:hypothetical protein